LRTKITCISSKHLQEWSTGEFIFGELKTGAVFDLPLDYCERLIDKKTRLF